MCQIGQTWALRVSKDLELELDVDTQLDLDLHLDLGVGLDLDLDLDLDLQLDLAEHSAPGGACTHHQPLRTTVEVR